MYNTILLYDDAPQTRGLQQVRVKVKAITACEPTAYSMTALKNAYNVEFADRGVDVYVTDCKQIRTPFTNNLIVDLSVAAEGLISVAVAALIILLIKLVAVTVAAIVIMSYLGGLVEIILPTPKWYAADGTEHDSLASMYTYQQNLFPTKFVCHYCGSVFDTIEERDAHQTDCPYKDGPPNGNGVGDLVKTALLGALVITGVAIVVPRLIKI